MPYQPDYRQSWAIVIGVNAYTRLTPLQNAVNDARLFATALRETCNFPPENILLLEDAAATRAEIMANFNRTLGIGGTGRAAPDDRVIIFFAGHGVTRTKRGGAASGYLALADFEREAWHDHCLSIDELLTQAEYTDVKHLLFVLDACFGGLALTRGATSERLAADLLTRPAVQALTAGMPDQMVSDVHSAGGQNSPFTGYVVEGLRGAAAGTDGLLTASQLYQYVRQRVATAPRAIQTPLFGNLSGEGDMVFARPRPAQLPNEVLSLLYSAQPRYRLLAIDDLALLLKDQNADLAALARTELTRLRDADPAGSVKVAAREALGELEIGELENKAQKAQLPTPSTPTALNQAEVKQRFAEVQHTIAAAQRVTPTPQPNLQSSNSLSFTSPFPIEFLHIPAGEFLMGSDPQKDKDAQDNEQPQHRVYVSEFYMGRYPITNSQFAVFAKAQKLNWEGARYKYKDQHPAVNVSWHDVVKFCEWLTSTLKHPFKTTTSKVFARLPTEAEWEKAARGSSASSGDGRIFPWGDAEPDNTLCNFNGYFGGTTPVGQFFPTGDSDYGISDLCGNVWEWCQSKYRPYPYTVDDGRERIDQSADWRVIRGGAFGNNRREARCAYRNDRPPTSYNIDIGFRVVLSPRS